MQILPFAALMTLSMYTLGLLISLAIFPLAVAISVGCTCLYLKLLHLTAGRKFKEEGPYASFETARWLLLNKAVNATNIVPLLNGESQTNPNAWELLLTPCPHEQSSLANGG